MSRSLKRPRDDDKNESMRPSRPESSRSNLISPIEPEYDDYCTNVREALLRIYKTAIGRKDIYNPEENPFDTLFYVDAIQNGLIKEWNLVLTHWFEAYQKRIKQCGIEIMTEQHMASELTVVLSKVFPRAAAEVSPSLKNRIDILVPSLRRKFAFIIELSYYYPPNFEMDYFIRDAKTDKSEYIQLCAKNLLQISPGVKLGRKLDQSYRYLKEMQKKPMYERFCCLATIIATDNAKPIMKNRVMSAARIFDRNSPIPTMFWKKMI